MESIRSGISWDRGPVARIAVAAVVLLVAITLMVGMIIAGPTSPADDLGAGNGSTELAGASWSGPGMHFLPAPPPALRYMGASWS